MCRIRDGRPRGSVIVGGQTTPIWIANAADSQIERIPRENSNDFNPMWVGNTIYFLSDRNGPVTLFAYDIGTRQVTEAVKNDGLDFKSASAGPDAIVIEQFGALKLFDPVTRQIQTVRINLAGDLPELRTQFMKVDPKRIHNFGVSPSGVRAVMEAWGEVFTVPVEKGDIRNLTHNPAVAERDPAWSPDGKSVACFSDASGEYGLEIRDQTGTGDTKKIALEHPPSTTHRSGRPTRRRSRSATSGSTSGTSTSRRASRSKWMSIITRVRPSTSSGRRTTSGSRTRSSCRTTCARCSSIRSSRSTRSR